MRSRQNTSSGSSDARSKASPSTTPHGQASEALLPVRFPFTSTSSSRATTPSSGSRTPHSPSSPTLPNFPVASKTARPSNLRLQQEGSDSSRRGSSPKDLGGSAVGHSPLPSGSDLSVYKSAPSTPLVSCHENGDTAGTKSPTINVTASPQTTGFQATSEDDQEQALKIFENRDENLDPGEVSAWLGDAGDARERVRVAYMSLFCWNNVDILSALRGLCARIALKGETQQVDRMLEAFSKRWCEGNCNHGFKSFGKTYS
jgi:Sec7 domain